MPNNGFFEYFVAHQGVQKFIEVAINILHSWKNTKLGESSILWLKEVESFTEMSFFFQTFLKNKQCKDLLFKVMGEEPTTETDCKQWEDDLKEAVKLNYKILADIFVINNNTELRN